MIRSLFGLLVSYVIEPLTGCHRAAANNVVGLKIHIGGLPIVSVRRGKTPEQVTAIPDEGALHVYLAVEADEPTIHHEDKVTPIPGIPNLFRVAEGGTITVIGLDGPFRDTGPGHEGVELRATRSLDGTLIIAARTLADGEACELLGRYSPREAGVEA